MSLEANNRWDGRSWRDGCWAASLCASPEWNLDQGYGEEEEEEKEKSREEEEEEEWATRGGCEATGLKWDFHLFIYLAELIAQGCLLAFCCMFCGLSAPFPLLPLSSVFLMWVYLKVQIYVCACAWTFTPLLRLPVFLWVCVCVSTVWVRVCVYFSSVYKCVCKHFVATITACVHPQSGMKWEPELVSRDEWYLLG